MTPPETGRGGNAPGIAVAAGAGLVAALLSVVGAWGFFAATEATADLLLWLGDGLPIRVLLGAVAVTAAAAIVRVGSRGYSGMNVADVVDAVGRRDGDLPPGPGAARTAASILTLAIGAPVGAVGPIVVVGAVLASR